MDKTEYRRRGIAIINPYGGVWSPHVFETPAEARQYLENFWRGITQDLSKYRLAMAEQTTTLLLPPGEPVFIDMPPAA